jgi:hypothetical protein
MAQPRMTRVVEVPRRMVQSKIFRGAIYSPGQENTLPPGFPMEGEHWDDYVKPEPALYGGVAGLIQQQHEQEQAAYDAAVERARETGELMPPQQVEKLHNDPTVLPVAPPRKNPRKVKR